MSLMTLKNLISSIQKNYKKAKMKRIIFFFKIQHQIIKFKTIFKKSSTK